MAGEHNPYQEYRTSNTGWLDDVPSTWSNARMDDIALTIRDQVSPKDIASLQVMHYSIPIIQVTGTGQEEDGSTIDSNKFQVKEGDVLFSKLNPRKQTITTVRSHYQPVVASTEFIVLRLKLSDQRFVQYLLYSQELKSFVCSQVESATKSHQRIHPSVISKLKLALPTEDERAAIANFLDHETAKIDTLIEKQQQLIKLLKEKRQAVISHAVTKGLNPNAPMRDSGVEWLGEVPEHWKMVPLKYLCNFSGGGTPSKDNLSYWTGGSIPWVSPKDMKSFWVSDTQDKLTESAVEESSTNYVEVGAILMVVRSGILQRTIPIAINTVRVTLNQDMKALRCNERIDVAYAANYIISNVSSLLLEWSKEGATVESIEQEYLSGSLIPVPPKQEQNSINEQIKKRMDVFTKLESRASKGIALLQERRTALISAAVTGKIDVRNWQAPQPSNKSNNNYKEVAA